MITQKLQSSILNKCANNTRIHLLKIMQNSEKNKIFKGSPERQGYIYSM